MTALLTGWLPVHAAPVEGDALAALGAVRLGVGKVAAAVALQRLLAARRPPGVLLFGVGGAYPVRHCSAQRLRLGDLAFVDPDAFGDEGVQTETAFLDLPALRLPALGPFPTTARAAQQSAAALLSAAVVAGTTVSTCSGTEALSAALAARTGALVESMEGAAVAHVCAVHGVPLLQLRSIANWTGDRTRAGWDLAGAVRHVQTAVTRLLGA